MTIVELLGLWVAQMLGDLHTISGTQAQLAAHIPAIVLKQYG